MSCSATWDLPAGWPAWLGELRDGVGAQLAMTPNFALLNLYRDGQDYMGWHTDNETTMHGQLASLSLGDTRRFLIEESSGTGKYRLDLEHGSLLLMNVELRHTLPRTVRQVGERINLTFRQIAER